MFNMDGIWVYLISIVSSIFLLLKLFSLKQTWQKNLPPSPPALPIIGHLHLLKGPFHKTLLSLSNQYGPIVSLKFGFQNVLIISSPALLDECFNKNAIIFANRPRLLAGEILNYNYTTINSSPYGHHWRNFRRIAAREIYSTNRLMMCLSIRQQEVRNLLKDLFENSRTSFQKVEMKSRLSKLSFNIIMRMILGKRCLGVQGEILEESKCIRDIISEIFASIIVAATDTSAATMEWTMSLLLNYPEVLKKARAEISKIVGEDRLVDESDFPNLPFLQSIIKESMRFKTIGPLLTPYESSDDCIIRGYHIPQGTMLIVNAWAIHMDPDVWEDPTSFKPERFEGLEDEAHKLIPFGLGMRACPGAGLANKVMGLALASLIQCFEWERPSEELVDMSEGSGLTTPKAQPLEAMCKARESMINVLEKL
ncbi:hypothetical protein GH714_012334 [Hevea brasiliensis]|uniref:Cytochrome P450 n=1 Tax=Hevea brasiliensis TaxID=3981 RepID=A0A6A6NGR0_HEVBR|nr:hypothetical protein GH714_012334 [Hevea brasiliensis]